jgi:hypothetical protein
VNIRVRCGATSSPKISRTESVPGGTSAHAREEEEKSCVGEEEEEEAHWLCGLMAAWENSATADVQATSGQDERTSRGEI